MSNREEKFSRWGFIAAAIGMAAGTGNIWRFPRVAVSNGGGTFIIAWMVALFVWSIPLLIAEMALGRKAKLGTIGTFEKLVGKKRTWMGAWVTWVCVAIMSYYSVVMGWTLKYFFTALTGKLSSNTEAIWQSFITSPGQTTLFHFISVVLCGIIIYKGITGGIEKVTKLLVPSLFVILVICAIRALLLPNSYEGLKYLFSVDPAKLMKPRIWLEAFTQSAWSTGAGWGFIITYAIYTKKNSDVGMNCFITGISNNLVSIIAALGIIPTIFALSSSYEAAMEAVNSGNTGLAFIFYPKLFPTMSGGKIIAVLFFLAMSMAALTSLIAMFEVAVTNLINFGLDRKKATLITSAVAFILGIPSAYNVEILNNQDFVWGVGLLVSGLFVSLAVIKYGAEQLRKNIINNPYNQLYIGKWWTSCIYLVPVIFAFIFGWWILQSITWYPDSWWNPFNTYSLGSIVLQYLIILVIIRSRNGSLSQNYGIN